MTAKPQRPRRQRKGDRLVSPDASRVQVAVDHAVAPFDRVATDLERKWGFDRLPELVTPELAAKYGRAIAYMNEALADEDADKVAAAAANGIKGLHAMDAAATAAGHQPPQAIAHGEVDGFTFRIVADGASSAAIQPGDPTPVFTMREIGLALRAYCRAAPIAEVKKHFPGSEIQQLPDAMPRSFFEAGGDPVPF